MLYCVGLFLTVFNAERVRRIYAERYHATGTYMQAFQWLLDTGNVKSYVHRPDHKRIKVTMRKFCLQK